MSKSHRGGHAHHKPPPKATMPDGAVYLGILMVGAFGVLLWHILGGEWPHALIGFVMAVSVLVNLYTWKVLQGKTLPAWQQALARLPLRCVGYGTKRGRPLAAAHNSDRARIMLFLSIAVSAAVIAGLTFLLIPI